MAVLTPAWWPRRRAEPTEAVGYESAMLPGTFEPIETLGDTGPAPLDEIGKRGVRSVAKQFGVVAGICALLFLYITFNGPRLL